MPNETNVDPLSQTGWTTTTVGGKPRSIPRLGTLPEAMVAEIKAADGKVVATIVLRRTGAGTGSWGFHAADKPHIVVEGKPVECQGNFGLTVVGSGDAPEAPAVAAAVQAARDAKKAKRAAR